MTPTRPCPPTAWLLVATLVLLPAAACGDQQSWSTAPEASGSAQPLPVDTVLTEYYSSIGTTRLLIDDSREWESFWRTVYESRTPLPDRPRIDFDREVVVAAGLGGRATGGHAIGIEAVARHGDTLFATIRESSPGDDCVLTQAVTHPVQAVRVPVSDVDVLVTVERDTTRDCG